MSNSVNITNPNAASNAVFNAVSNIVLVCEHASAHIPPQFQNLGLAPDTRNSHAAWDPGALAVAQHLSQSLNAALVASTVSRLVYDCNRPPSSPSAMPARSEVIEIPGNANLSQTDRDARTAAYYTPFYTALAEQIAKTTNPIIVTIHSFTPIYHGHPRAVEIGVLHDADTRLADAMLATAANHTTAQVERNQPYGPADGVTHTLIEHALPNGHPNVMLEIRNDLIQTETQQRAMADTLTQWLTAALATSKEIPCVA